MYNYELGAAVFYFNWLYFFPVNDLQVDDYRTPLEALNNDSLTLQPTKAPSFFGKTFFYFNCCQKNIIILTIEEYVLELCFLENYTSFVI